MSRTIDIMPKPVLYFFSRVPEYHLSRPGFAAALQSFETGVFLLAAGRWPTVIGQIWHACELALRVYSSLGPGDYGRAWQLQDHFLEKHPEIGEKGGLHDRSVKLREYRNELSHRGYSPKDDLECADRFLNTGIPYFELLFEAIVGCRMSSFHGQERDGRWFWLMLEKSKKVFNQRLHDQGAPPFDSLFFLIKSARRIVAMGGRVETCFAPYSQSEVILQEEFQDTAWHVQQIAIKNLIQRMQFLDEPCLLPECSCPVCGKESVIADIDRDDYKYCGLRQVGCFECEYIASSKDLVKEFFEDSLTAQQIEVMNSQDFEPLNIVV